MKAAVVAFAIGLAAVVGMSIGPVTTTASGCYAMDIGSPGEPWTVLVSDSTTDGLCHDGPEGERVRS